MISFRILATLFAVTATLTLARAETSWVGSINCSYGAGSLKLSVDDAGNVSGGMTNGRITSGRMSGKSINFAYANAFGNGGTFTGSVNGASMSGTYTQRVGTAKTCQWQASRQGSTPSKTVASTEYCGLTLGKKMTACVGSDDKCACVTFRNNCPYPVSVAARLSGVKGSGRISTNVDGGKVGKLCATRDSSQQVEYLGWKPWAGYPKKGQPRPKG